MIYLIIENNTVSSFDQKWLFLRLCFASFPFFRHIKTKWRQIHRHMLRKFNKRVKEAFHVPFTLHTLWARRRRKSTIQTRPPSYWEKHQEGFAGMSPMTTLDSKSDSQRKHSSLVKQTILMLAVPDIWIFQKNLNLYNLRNKFQMFLES